MDFSVSFCRKTKALFDRHVGKILISAFTTVSRTGEQRNRWPRKALTSGHYPWHRLTMQTVWFSYNPPGKNDPHNALSRDRERSDCSEIRPTRATTTALRYRVAWSFRIQPVQRYLWFTMLNDWKVLLFVWSFILHSSFMFQLIYITIMHMLPVCVYQQY